MAEDVEINSGVGSGGPVPGSPGNHDDSMEVVTVVSPSATMPQPVESSADVDSQVACAGDSCDGSEDRCHPGLVVNVTNGEDMITDFPVPESVSSVMAADTRTASPVPGPSSASVGGSMEESELRASPRDSRTGSTGELDARGRPVISASSRDEENVKIVDNLDTSPLPRPPNPGGILPLNGDSGTGNSPLDLIINGRERRRNLSLDSQFDSHRTFLHDQGIYRIRPAAEVSSFLGLKETDIVSTSREKIWSSSINEGVERPLPSSVVDSEGLAKKIARLDHQLPSSNGLGSLWSGSLRSSAEDDHLSSVRTIVDRTPPERPKPPRPKLSPLADQTAVSTCGESVVTSATIQVSSPVQTLSPSQSRSLVHPADTTPHGDRSPEVIDAENSLYRASPDDVTPCPTSMFYKCRFCNFTAGTYSQLQMHIPRHGGHQRGMKCPLCDYVTTDKSNFRRHRRLHIRNNPLTLLKCGKCSYSTTSDRKMREHYQQAHNDIGTPGMLVEPITDNSVSTPLGGRYPGSRCMSGLMGYNGACNGAAGDHMVNGIGTVMVTGQGAAGYPYTPTNRQPLANCSFDVFTGIPPCGSLRNVRDGNQLSSNYLRSIVSSVMNSQTPQRQAASSTITSSSYFMPTVADSSENMPNLENIPDHQGCMTSNNGSHPMKVKVEPIDIDGASDVSSSGSQYNTASSDVTCSIGNQQTSHRCAGNTNTCSCLNGSIDLLSPTCSMDQTSSICQQRLGGTCSVHESTSDHARPRDLRVSTQSDVSPSRMDIENSSGFNSNISNSGITMDSTTRGIQCVLASVKSEINPDHHVCHFDCCAARQFRVQCVDRAVQCNLSASSDVTRSHRMGRHAQSSSETDSIGGESRCCHCGIHFEDEVMFSIHVGCHSHTDPFTCNICGKPCGNKYGFYSHIMRGHHL